jgi:hypothetical protein
MRPMLRLNGVLKNFFRAKGKNKLDQTAADSARNENIKQPKRFFSSKIKKAIS